MNNFGRATLRIWLTPARMAGLGAALMVASVMAVPAVGAVRAAQPFDFNGDGFADLAVGAPHARSGSGTVNVLYAGADGVSAARDRLLTQDTPGIREAIEPGDPRDAFGGALASADFDRDGYADLAIGAPYETLDDTDKSNADGVVHVLYGSATGISAQRDQLWRQGRDGVPGEPSDSAFGSSLAAGDFDGDGYRDLAIGAPWAEVGGKQLAGEVYVIHGSAQGLSGAAAQRWSQNSPGVSDEAEFSQEEQENIHDEIYGSGERFGASLATGDVNGDRRADLVIGVPKETVHGSCKDASKPCSKDAIQAGAVHLLLGGADGLTSEGEQFWHQNSPGVRGEARSQYDKPGEQFGAAVAVGDFNGDGYGDVVAGAPNDKVSAVPCDGAELPCPVDGAVNVLYGSKDGITTVGDDFWHMEVPGVAGKYGGRFGGALATGDVDRDGDDDLAIGVPNMMVSGRRRAGAVLVLRGRAGGLHEDGDTLWTLDTRGVRGTASFQAFFGSTVDIRPMGRSRAPELVVGARGQRVGDLNSAGRVSVLYGSSSGPTADGDQLWSKATRGVRGEPENYAWFGVLRHWRVLELFD